MFDRYFHQGGDMMAAIVRRVAAGERVGDICRDGDLPSETTVRNWRRRWPGFDQAMAEALRQGADRRRGYDPVLGEAFLARYRACEAPLSVILADPAMPSRAQLMGWMSLNSAFRDAFHAARRLQADHRLRGLRKLRTPAAFDPEVADRVLVAMVRGRRLRDFCGGMRGGDPGDRRAGRGRDSQQGRDGLPGRGVIRRWRRENRVFDAEVRAALIIGQRRDSTAGRRCGDLTPMIAERIILGASLHSLSQEAGMPSTSTLYRWVREQPAFAAIVTRACEAREDIYTDQIFEVLDVMATASRRSLMSRLAPISKQRARLRHRPGAKRARAMALEIAAHQDPQSVDDPFNIFTLM